MGSASWIIGATGIEVPMDINFQHHELHINNFTCHLPRDVLALHNMGGGGGILHS